MGETCRAEDRAQATVEMAIVAPVMLVLALIVYNVMMFVSATARFDRVAPDVVLAHGVAPAGDATGVLSGASAAAQVEKQLAQAMDGHEVRVEVVVEGGEGSDGSDRGSLLSLVGSLRTYRCTLRYRPWPQGLSIAGVDLGAPFELVHSKAVTVDPWKSGVIV